MWGSRCIEGGDYRTKLQMTARDYSATTLPLPKGAEGLETDETKSRAATSIMRRTVTTAKSIVSRCVFERISRYEYKPDYEYRRYEYAMIRGRDDTSTL